jgi:uncharacterized protein YgiM (DUF1202 family)
MAPVHTHKSCWTKRLPRLGLPGVVLLLWGCASQQSAPVQGPEPEPAPADPPGDVAQTERQQAAEIRSLREDLAELQLQALGKEAEVAELRTKLDEAIQEVVRTKAKLQSVESRAEAASTMAEAEIALKAVREATAEPGPEVFEAEQLLEMSVQEFEGENYGGSLYLASQAMSLVSIGQGRLGGDDLPGRTGEVQFAIPLRMEVARTSNVREGPGLNFQILFTLQANAKLVGLAYKDQWVRVRDEDKRSGWIFHSLVRGSNR